MEANTNTETVVYIDEYPELAKRVWLRRLAAQRMSKVVDLPRVLEFPELPDGVA